MSEPDMSRIAVKEMTSFFLIVQLSNIRFLHGLKNA